MIYPTYIENNHDFPVFYRVRMNYPSHKISDVGEAVHKAVHGILDKTPINAGDNVAVCVGSRGISGLSVMVKHLCDALKEIGAHLFIIPAMGSHGGATAMGQEKVLESLSVTETVCGAPVISSMDVEKIGEVLDGVPVYFPRDCLKMDHVVCINRIKPHTKFKGPVESGIYKMLGIGMGKHQGAVALHQAALRHGFSPVIKHTGDMVIQMSNFRFALAVVEDHYDDVMDIRAILAKDVFEQEKNLLETAKAHFPTLPFANLDVLVIGQIGKEISGSGMDPNVTGRACDLMEDDFSENLAVTRIVILDLSEKTDGNGIGLGNADIITEQAFRKLDYEKTLINALTSTSLRKAFIPVRLPDDRRAINAAVATSGKNGNHDIRIVLIKDTRNVSEFWASASLLDEIRHVSGAEIMEHVNLSFNSSGELDLFNPVSSL